MKIPSIQLRRIVIISLFLMLSFQNCFLNLPLNKSQSSITMDTSQTNIIKTLATHSPYFSTDQDITITIQLISPQNNSIVNGGTMITIFFTDINGTEVSPVTELYKWDNSPNYESILRPLPYDDGSHTLSVLVESETGIWTSSAFVFYSDNTPPEVTLLSPENGTHILSGSNIQHWTSSYPSGSLTDIDLSDVNGDNNPDVLVGGASNRIYAFDGLDGSNEWLTGEFTGDINVLTVLDGSRFMIGLANGGVHILSNSFGSTLSSNLTETSTVLEIVNDSTTEKIFVLHTNNLRVYNYTGHFKWETNYSDSDSQTLFMIDDVFGDNNQEIIVINQSSFVRIYNQTNGSQLTNYTIDLDLKNAIADNQGYLYSTFSNGYVRKYNITDGGLTWETDIETGQNVWDIKISDNRVICSTGSGKIIVLDIDGGHQYTLDASSSFIKDIFCYDFDQDFLEEIFTFDGVGILRNFNLLSGLNNWNYTSGVSIQNIVYGDINNDTFQDAVFIGADGSVTAIDPRARIPKLVPAWTDVSFSFDDDICGNIPLWEKYSWDGQPNQSSPGVIPSSSGIHSLSVWISDNASNIAHTSYDFFSFIGVKINSPTNNSYQQGGTPINLTLSEVPLQQLYTWDGGSSETSPSPIPLSETTHTLEVFIKDTSQSFLRFNLIYTTDNTPISFINLQSPLNDSVVEGGENITINFSENPYIEYYSWNSEDNTTNLGLIPVRSDTHILDVFVSDEAMNWKSSRFVFHTKIQINLISHLNNSIILPNDLLNFTFGKIPDRCLYQINSGSTISLSPSIPSIIIPMPSSSQTHRLTVSINDSENGRWNIEEYIFKTKLVVNMTSHINGSYAEIGDSIVVDFSDTPTTKLFSWDGQQNSSRDPIVPGPGGVHYLDIYVGNYEGDFWSYHFEFTIDTDLIDILLISPTNNTRINSWDNVSIQFSETPHAVYYTWDSYEPNNTLSSIPSIDGGHLLNVTVFDIAGNMNYATFYWIVDDTPINVTVFNMEDETVVYSGTLLNVSFNNETPMISWYSWNNETFSPTLPPVPWGNGSRTLNITVFDGINWNTCLLNYTVVDLPPTISVIDSDIPYQSHQSLTIETDETLSTSWHKWNDGSQIQGLVITTPDNEGENTLTIHAVDLGASVTEISLTIIVDNTPITIISIDPKNNSNVKGGENITIVFSEIPHSVTYSWNDGGRSDNLTSIPVEIGEKHLLNIKAFDQAGNLLDVDIHYKLPSREEVNAPIIISGLALTVVIVTTVVIKRNTISGFLKKTFKPPKSAK